MKLALRRDPMSRFINDDDWFGWDHVEENQMDMWEEDDKIHVKVKAPDFKEDDIEVSIENNVLTITGKKEYTEEEEDKKKKFYRKEFATQSFTRSATMPAPVKAEEADASFKGGVLQVVVPKSEEAKPKKIVIKGEN